VRDTLDVVELDYPRPRTPLPDMLDADHQSPPMLVLAKEPVRVPNVTIAEVNGRWCVEKTIEILRYLAATRSVPGPH
jgi:hypothetical protein